MASLQWCCCSERWWNQSFSFVTSLCKGAWISFLIFTCDNPTYNPNPCAFCFVMRLGYLFLSLVLRNLHITPITPPCIVKMLLHWWWFTSTAWHAHNCEWTVSHRILNIGWWNPVVGVSTDNLRKGVQLVG